MKQFDEKNASADELWEYCMYEYNNQNIISKKLFDRFFSKLSLIVSGFEKSASVLEVGCGAGESSARIFKMLNGNYFEASDVDIRYVEKLNSLGLSFKVTEESVYSLHRRDKEFDHIIMLEVLEHLEDYEKALSELFRVARKSVTISVPNEPLWRILNCIRLKYLSDLGNTPGHINHFSGSELKKLLGKYGIVKQVYKPLPWLIMECEPFNQ